MHKAGSTPRAAACEVWLADLTAMAAGLEELERRRPRLSPAEQRHFEERPDERRQWWLSHIALRLVLVRVFGEDAAAVPFDVSPRGKPTLPGCGGSFSLSHSGGFALIGVTSDVTIGVDVESMREVRFSEQRLAQLIAAARALNPSEPLPIETENRSMQAWVRIEAAAKALGEGVGPLLTALGITRRGETGGGSVPAEALAGVPGQDLQIFDLAAGAQLRAAVAVARGAPRPVLQHLPAGVLELMALTG